MGGQAQWCNPCNPSTLRSRQPVPMSLETFKTSLGNRAKTHQYKKQTGVMLHTCSPSYLGGLGGRTAGAQEAEGDPISGKTTRKKPKKLNGKKMLVVLFVTSEYTAFKTTP